MEKQNAISGLMEALKACSEAKVTVALAFRCAVDTLPDDMRERFIEQRAEADQITIEAAEALLKGKATSMAMTNASPDMGGNALLSLFSELNALQGNLAADVLVTDERRLAEAASTAKVGSIILPGQ